MAPTGCESLHDLAVSSNNQRSGIKKLVKGASSSKQEDKWETENDSCFWITYSIENQMSVLEVSKTDISDC